MFRHIRCDRDGALCCPAAKAAGSLVDRYNGSQSHTQRITCNVNHAHTRTVSRYGRRFPVFLRPSSSNINGDSSNFVLAWSAPEEKAPDMSRKEIDNLPSFCCAFNGIVRHITDSRCFRFTARTLSIPRQATTTPMILCHRRAELLLSGNIAVPISVYYQFRNIHVALIVLLACA